MHIVSLNVGKPQTIMYQGKELETGIYKQPVKGPVFLSSVNFEGDAQADLINHGGPDKAVCVYPYEHYAYWEKELGRTLAEAAFGENLTVSGMLEEDVCIGDIYELGDAVVQISQPRQPCHKLAKKYDVADLPVRVQDTGYTGYYFRVLREGSVVTDQPIRLLERDMHGVTIQFANRIKYQELDNLEGIGRILQAPGLSANWRKSFEKRLVRE